MYKIDLEFLSDWPVRVFLGFVLYQSIPGFVIRPRSGWIHRDLVDIWPDPLKSCWISKDLD